MHQESLAIHCGQTVFGQQLHFHSGIEGRSQRHGMRPLWQFLAKTGNEARELELGNGETLIHF